MQELADRIAAIVAIDQQGPLGSRPAAGTAGNYYTDTATGITYRDDGTQWRALNAPVGNGVPTGAVIFIPNDSTPTGFLKCDGAAYSRSTYSALFSFGGTAAPFGPGDGSTTFNVPDYKGRKLVGKGGHTTVDTVGKNEGLADASRAASHSHTHSLTIPSHTHTINPYSISNVTSGGDFSVWLYDPVHSTTTVGGGGGAVNGIINSGTEPYAVGNWWIKT
jgi:microcystin-dependent protein